MGSFISLPVLVLAAVLQVTLMPQISILGGRPDLIFLIVVSWSLNSSLEEAVLWAFVGGISKDLLSAAPLGTSTLGLIIILFAVHSIREQVYSVGLFTLIWVSILGSLFQQITILIIVYLAGFQPAFADTVGYGAVIDQIGYFVIPTIVYNLVAILPVYWFVRRLQIRIGLNERFTR